MADAEINMQPSKKRAAGIQLSRENPGLDDDEETTEQETETFKRASDEVLAARRIVRVRRQQTPSISSPVEAPAHSSNPFSAICLVPTTPQEAPVFKVTSEETEQVEENESKSETEVNEVKGEPNEQVGENDDAKKSDNKDNESKTESNAEKVKSDEANKQNIIESVTEGDKIAADANLDEKTKEENDAEGKANEKDNGEKCTETSPETASFSSFQKLSSGQNAFSGISGTGFSSTSFSFGSVPKDGSPVESGTGSLFGLTKSQPTFNFGGNSSIFGTSAANVSEGEVSKFPTMKEVPLETGEENEKAVFTADSVLFEFVDGSWKERGKGEIKLNISTKGTSKARLIMRARGNFRLILNASLFLDMKLTNMDKKGITFACVNSASEGKNGLSTIALKFKDPSIVEEFRAAVMEHKAKTSVPLKTPENSP